MFILSLKRHRFPRAVIGQAVRYYFRLTLSIDVVEQLTAR